MIEKNGKDLAQQIFGSGTDEPSQLQLSALLMPMFAGLRGNPVRADGQVEFHDGAKMVLPRGMTYTQAIQILQRHELEMETPTRWDRQFKYRADDGAHAAMLVFQRLYGVASGDSRTVESMFGKYVVPSESRTIAVGLNMNQQVAWGTITIPALPGLEIILCDRHPHPEYGTVFEMHITGPRKYGDDVENIFNAIEEELRTNSIYRGQALTGSNKLEFFDISTIRREEIVFSDDVTTTLEAKLWSVLRYPDVVAGEGVSLKRTILLYGPYGTGKTSAGLLTAQIARDHGWTFLAAKTGDDITSVLGTGRLYDPTVVFFEDIDRESGKNDEDGLSELLDAFDGITSKGGRLVVVLTTNRVKDVPKGMLRPGRLDACIRIAELDRNGIERLTRALVPAHKLASDIDFDVVATAMTDYLPAFVREAINSSKLYAITRLNGDANFVITTEDLVFAANSLRAQFDAHRDAPDEVRTNTVDHAFTGLVKDTLHGATVTDRYGEVVTFSLNGKVPSEQ